VAGASAGPGRAGGAKGRGAAAAPTAAGTASTSSTTLAAAHSSSSVSLRVSASGALSRVPPASVPSALLGEPGAVDIGRTLLDFSLDRAAVLAALRGDAQPA
jgi:hypothetical protein